MGQVTIYLENEVQKKVTDMAKDAGYSLSKWISLLLKKEINTQWPQSIQDLAGAWNDFPSLEEIRSNMGKDVPREILQMFALDTNTVIFFFKGQGNIQKHLFSQSPNELFIP